MAISVLTTHDLRKGFSFQKKNSEGRGWGRLGSARRRHLRVLESNGAGKTTTLRMLTTLLVIDRGEATVAGIDVRTRPHEVRRRIGYVSQIGGADDEATDREDLMLQGRLYVVSMGCHGGPRAAARAT